MPSPWYRPVQGVVRQEVAGGSPVHTPVFADGGTPEDPQESERHPPPEAPASPVRVATTPPAATPPRHNTRGSTIESRHAAGVSSAPRRIGKRMCVPGPANTVLPSNRSDPWGDRDKIFSRGSGEKPQEPPYRRTLGVSRAHSLPSDYAKEGMYSTTSRDIGREAEGGEEARNEAWPPAKHDVLLGRYERSAEDRTAPGYTPPGGWEAGDADYLPPDSAVLFGADAKGAPRDIPYIPLKPNPRDPKAPSVKEQAVRTEYVWKVGQGHETRRLPVDIPTRPPGCGVGKPAPARHPWLQPEPSPPTAVVDLNRPAMLPKTSTRDPRFAHTPPKAARVYAGSMWGVYKGDEADKSPSPPPSPRGIPLPPDPATYPAFRSHQSPPAPTPAALNTEVWADHTRRPLRM